MSRIRSKKWLDNKRVSFTLSFTNDPEVLTFLYEDRVEAARLVKHLLRDHVMRSAHRCADLAVCAAIRRDAMRADADAPPFNTAQANKRPPRAEAHPEPPTPAAPPDRGAAELSAQADGRERPPTPRSHGTDSATGANRNTIKTFLS